jgi:hypothetical protein
MLFSSWLRKKIQKPAPQNRFRPQLEALDDRIVPSTLTVTTAADSASSSYSFAPGSLREEIAVAQSGDTIVFDKSLKGQTITLSGFLGELYIEKNLDIEGLGAKNLAISGAGERVFEVDANVQVTLAGMTIENGYGQAYNNGSGVGWGGGLESFQGGGILNSGTLTVSGCTVTGNKATYGGGGIANEFGGTLTISGCTVSHNASLFQGGIGGFGGGGIYNDGTLTLSGSTVTQNSGGGIFNDYSGVLTILSSTVKSNHYEPDLYNLGTWSADSSSTIGTVGP